MDEEIERVQVIAEKNNGSPPKRFIQKESNRPILETPLGKIPIIDLSYVESKDLDQREVEDSKLKSAASSWGIFQVLRHGIPTSLMNEVRSVTRLFFQQPLKDKQIYTSDSKILDFKEGYSNDIDESRGLIPGFEEGYESETVLSHEQILDWNDKLLLNVYPEEERNIDLWPQKPESFRKTINEFNEKLMINIVDEIFKALARSLGLDEVYFINKGVKGRVRWRFNYYPPCSKPDLVLGIKSHSDGSSFTVLLPDDKVPGLQVFNDEFGWVKVPVVQDALVVFLGDEIEIMSNGQFKSVVHQVVTNSENSRVSLSMFVLSKPENELGPIDELIEEGKPRLYRTTTAKDYGDDFYVKFSQGTRPLDFMRI